MARMNHLLATGALVMSSSMALAAGQANTTAQGAGQASASTNRNEPAISLSAGTALNAQLSQTIDSKKAKPGDEVTVQTTIALKSDDKVVIPKGTKVIGHVTRSTARAKGDADSALAMQFDRAIMKDGREMPLQATIQALAADQRAAVRPDELQPAPHIEAGAAGAGAAGDRGVIGGVGSTVGGAASGAASTVPRTTADQSGAVNSTVSGAANAADRTQGGLTSSGDLLPTSKGVFGIEDLNLTGNIANSTEGSVITSAGKNVRLDGGTRLLLVTQVATSASTQR
jgi:hypothetical protein